MFKFIHKKLLTFLDPTAVRAFYVLGLLYLTAFILVIYFIYSLI
jgi:phage shock protein PspC (stress-responsive transcriptional regulator)